MPRLSKKRGVRSTNYTRDFKYIHRVCLVTAKDEYDNFLFKIAGLGVESEEMFNNFTNYFDSNCTIISDNKFSIKNFAINNKMNLEVILSTIEMKKYTTSKGNSLSEVNQLHQEFSELIRKKHGVSIRHLQSYIDWLLFCKKIKYTIDGKRRKVESYVEVMKQPTSLTTRLICKKELPIDLYTAYGDFHYGIFESPTIWLNIAIIMYIFCFNIKKSLEIFGNMYI